MNPRAPHGPRGLWICRALPFPLDTGDRIYSASLVRAVADAGASLHVVGFAPEAGTHAPVDWPVRWETVSGRPHGPLRSLLSDLPLVGAAHFTTAFRRKIETLALEPWDFVVADQYGMGWALAPFLRRRAAAQRAPVLVHVAHDHEASVYASLVRGYRGPTLKRIALWQNWIKTRRLERKIVRNVDLVSAITPEDAGQFAVDAPRTDCVVLTPGYSGAVAGQRRIDASVPRQVVMIGNYRWIAKAENLRLFVAAADLAFHAKGIELHVIGSMAPELADELRRVTKATVLHGFVADVAPHLARSRIAIVPEEIGGGFKLKFLDYIFGRVPVATLTHAAAGLPASIRSEMIMREGMAGLVDAIIEHIDDDEALTRMQDRALAAAREDYRWGDRGQKLLRAIEQHAQRQADGADHRGSA